VDVPHQARQRARLDKLLDAAATRKPLRIQEPPCPIPRPDASRRALAELEDHGAFQRRHIGPDARRGAMLRALGFASRARSSTP
jgi:hypothetical protein